jgi:hypothetical protein
LVYIEVKFCRWIIFIFMFKYLTQIYFYVQFYLFIIVLSNNFFYHCQCLQIIPNQKHEFVWKWNH